MDAVPGDKLDAEFAALRNAVSTLSEQLDDIRRDDGKLKNELITPSTLDPKLVTVLTDQLRKRIDAELKATTVAASQALAIANEVRADTALAIDAAKSAAKSASSIELKSGTVLQRIREAEATAKSAAERADDAASSALRVIQSNFKVAGDGGEAEKWAYDSMHWAEYMDGNHTIPPNFLEHMGITGDHWSSRWWAHRSQELGEEAVEGIFKYYIGAYAAPPSECPNGDALTPGVLYYDTNMQCMYVWDGDSWNPIVVQVPTPADLLEFHYTAYSGQTVFGGADIFGNTPVNLLAGNANVFLNGVRLTERINWQVLDDGHVVINRAAVAGSTLTIEWFASSENLATGRKVDVVPWVFDGSRRTFPILVNGALYSPTSAENMLVSVDGVMLDPGVDFTISGSDITFCEAPFADARKWAVAGVPISGGLGGGGGGSTPAAISFLRCVYIASSSGQTTYSGVDKYNHILTGLASLDNVTSVHVNGVLLEDDQWHIVNDTTLQLLRGPSAGSSVTIDVFTVDTSGGGSVTVPDHNHDAGMFG
jgi:hypothetical protein